MIELLYLERFSSEIQFVKRLNDIFLKYLIKSLEYNFQFREWPGCFLKKKDIFVLHLVVLIMFLTEIKFHFYDSFLYLCGDLDYFKRFVFNLAKKNRESWRFATVNFNYVSLSPSKEKEGRKENENVLFSLAKRFLNVLYPPKE